MSTFEPNIYASLPALLLPWYETAKRDLPWRRDRDPYHVWVSEIMLQQTRVEAVIGYYDRFLAALPSIRALAEVSEDELLKLWEGLGYYSRARNLQKAAKQILSQYGGVFPSEPAAAKSLAGIGEYTAGAILSICFDRPTAAVDGNVLRVISRVCGSTAPIDAPQTKKAIAEKLSAVYPAGHCGQFTQSLMELGATVCVPRGAKCDVCPLREICVALSKGLVAEMPVKSPKKARRIEERTVFCLDCDGKIALCRRESSGLLASMWQMPNLAGRLDTPAALAAADGFGVRPTEILKSVDRVHIFTHVEWHMTCYFLRCALPAPDFVWADRAELADRYALPTAFRQFLEE